MDTERSSPEALLRLLQLVSPALPVGAYNFSQGLEYAVEVGWVDDELSALDWIGGIAAQGTGRIDVPAFLRLRVAWRDLDHGVVEYWNAWLIAQRETAELRAEERHLGVSLAKILVEAEIVEAQPWTNSDNAAFATLFALASERWQIPARDAACGLLWSWIENQVLGAIKLIPLGQSAGQRLLNGLAARIPAIVECAAQLTDEELAGGSPHQAFASLCHETQYSRLFRS